ncbi:MAG: Tgt2/MlaC family protein [Campylobacter sp.]
MKFLKPILVLFLSTSLFAMSEQEIKPNLQTATAQAIEILRDKTLDDSSKANKIYAIFDPYFDYEQMAKIALSKRYKTLNDEQKMKFNKAFEDRLKASYVDKLLGYTDQKVVFKDSFKPKPDRNWLSGELINGSEIYGFVYKLYDAKERGWLIYDIEILGVSILQTYRSQFESLMDNESFDGLIEKLNLAKPLHNN